MTAPSFEFDPTQYDLEASRTASLAETARTIAELSIGCGRSPRYLDVAHPEGGIKINTPSDNSAFRKLVNRAMESANAQASSQPPKIMPETDYVRRRSMRRER
jgi:hypothetical protein